MFHQFGNTSAEYQRMVASARQSDSKLRVIGKGDTSVCYEVNPDTVLINSVVKDNPAKKAQVEHAIEIMKELGRLHHAEYDAKEGRYYIVQKKINGRELKDQFFDEPTPPTSDPQYAMTVALSAVDKLDQLHRQGIMHGDLHVGNMLVDSKGSVELIDFDWSEKLGSGGAVTTPTKPNGEHHAPEWVKDGKASFAADTYSLGYLLKDGSFGMFGLKMQDKFKDDKTFCTFLDRMTNPDPNQRPKLSEVKQALLDVKARMDAKAGVRANL